MIKASEGNSVTTVGEYGPILKEESALLLKKTCNSCGKQNYFFLTKMCKSGTHRPHTKTKIKNIQDSYWQECGEEDGSDTSPEYGMFNITSQIRVLSESKDEPYVTKVTVSDQEITMEIETGCRHTIINEQTFRKIYPETDPNLFRSSKKLSTYIGERIPVKGEIGVKVKFKGKDS